MRMRGYVWAGFWCDSSTNGETRQKEERLNLLGNWTDLLLFVTVMQNYE
jgi:hypothetical protein